MSITPVAITQPNWPTLTKVVSEATGVSPVRCLDTAHISPLTDITAFFRVLNMENAPTVFDTRASQHVYVSFLGVFEESWIYPELASCGRLSFLRKRHEEKDMVLISGALTDWAFAVKYWSHGKTAIRKIANSVYSTLKPFRLWETCIIQQHADGTLIFK